mgnify:CR=1 FL=1
MSSYVQHSDCSQTDLINSISKVITTNLTYLPPELYEKPYFVKADMSKFIALIIDSLNHDVPISSVISPTDKIHALLEKREKGLL